MSLNKSQREVDEKIYWIECIRVFSTFMVVMQHSISGMWTTVPPETVEWKIINLLFLLSRSAVPVFFMCSGIGMLSKERTIKSIFKKNISGILKPYVCWMLVFGVRDMVLLLKDGEGNFRTIRNAFLKDILFGQYHTWFIMTLSGLYLITPFVYEIAKNQKLLNYFLILAVIFTVILPQAGKIESLERLNTTFNTINMRFVTGYVMYYVLGFWLSKTTWNSKYSRSIIVLLFTVSLFTAFFISNMISVKSGEPSQIIYGEFAPLGFMVNMSLLLFFKTFIHSEKMKKYIVKLAGCGMGIYLMHPLFLQLISLFPGISCILGGIVIWLIALIISISISQTGKVIYRNFS